MFLWLSMVLQLLLVGVIDENRIVEGPCCRSTRSAWAGTGTKAIHGHHSARCGRSTSLHPRFILQSHSRWSMKAVMGIALSQAREGGVVHCLSAILAYVLEVLQHA